MSSTKHGWQNKLEQWKYRAKQQIFGTEDIEESAEPIELSAVMLEKCKIMAEAEQTTVNDVVQQILEHYWLQRSNELSTPISREHIDRNPIFLLDALAHRNFKPFGVGESHYDQ
ncbi:hypothetical protein GC093_13350 [Paenibacillus sp. LMG 31456]|uniref:Uncharacterized protein n=1 Tax=Paenibacillus foliorum TaxID=2654974 RepID=A0A972K0V2_9BACL|nr:hypothetical protein [Paenibacillus foliorum]NOU94195.1 hypothetical protein [Paenibacillus foliorum]